MTADTKLAAHLNASPAHRARDISLSGIFVNFYADDVAEAIQKIDVRLAEEIVNRQTGQVNAAGNITNLQTLFR